MTVIITQYNRTTTVKDVKRVQYAPNQGNTAYLQLNNKEQETFEDITFLIIQ